MTLTSKNLPYPIPTFHQGGTWLISYDILMCILNFFVCFSARWKIDHFSAKGVKVFPAYTSFIIREICRGDEEKGDGEEGGGCVKEEV